MSARPSVLFVCVRNGGKSQTAAGLMRQVVGGTMEISSAGTSAGDSINALSAAALWEAGVDITAERPQQLTDPMIAAADLVVVLGREAQITSTSATPIEVWMTDEPSTRGIDGIERMRLIRDDISSRVGDLVHRLGQRPTP